MLNFPVLGLSTFSFSLPFCHKSSRSSLLLYKEDYYITLLISFGNIRAFMKVRSSVHANNEWVINIELTLYIVVRSIWFPKITFRIRRFSQSFVTWNNQNDSQTIANINYYLWNTQISLVCYGINSIICWPDFILGESTSLYLTLITIILKRLLVVNFVEIG